MELLQCRHEVFRTPGETIKSSNQNGVDPTFSCVLHQTVQFRPSILRSADASIDVRDVSPDVCDVSPDVCDASADLRDASADAEDVSAVRLGLRGRR